MSRILHLTTEPSREPEINKNLEKEVQMSSLFRGHLSILALHVLSTNLSEKENATYGNVFNFY